MSLNRKARRNLARTASPAPAPILSPATLGPLLALFHAGRYQQALPLAEALLAQWPASAQVLEITGTLRLHLGDAAGAATAFARACALAPDKAGHFSNLGVCHRRLGQHQLASQAFLRAIDLDPTDPDLPYNLGNLLRDLGQNAMAVQQFARAIELCPTHAQALINLGATLLDMDHVEEAQHVLRIAVRQAPENLQAIVNLAVVCDFEAYRAFARLPAGWAPSSAEFPGLFLHFEDNPQRQLARSRAWAQAHFLTPPSPLPAPTPAPRIRVGFLSADYHDHATMRLIAGLLRSHDRTKFAFHAFSYGPDRPDEWRQFARDHHEAFHDIAPLSDADAVAHIRAQSLDVLIDLKGFTKGNRSHLLGARLAPVQVAWLGYPGSLGHSCADYALVDARVLPRSLRHTFDEHPIWLPGSYQCNDDQRAITPDPATRADHGLPAHAFVFCSFNHTYKISPAEFDIWMRLLAQVEGSVLWLLQSNAVVTSNLRAEAQARGIDPARLIFAQPRQHNAHLGRIAHADLFLDSFAVNAHTTASDALWAGLPVLTMAGQQFAARVGASLLTAAGLPELITTTPADYEALALALAQDPAQLAALRQRLADTRLSCPLFDTAGFTRNFEAALTAIHRRHLAGLPPADLDLENQP